jgi:hypothetical protein
MAPGGHECEREMYEHVYDEGGKCAEWRRKSKRLAARRQAKA